MAVGWNDASEALGKSAVGQEEVHAGRLEQAPDAQLSQTCGSANVNANAHAHRSPHGRGGYSQADADAIWPIGR
jgi:hypothetical protein